MDNLLVGVGVLKKKKTKERKERQETRACCSDKGAQERVSDEVTFE